MPGRESMCDTGAEPRPYPFVLVADEMSQALKLIGTRFARLTGVRAVRLLRSLSNRSDPCPTKPNRRNLLHLPKERIPYPNKRRLTKRPSNHSRPVTHRHLQVRPGALPNGRHRRSSCRRFQNEEPQPTNREGAFAVCMTVVYGWRQAAPIVRLVRFLH